MSFSVEDIKRLRELTGVGITDAKRALEEAAGGFDKALEAMRVKGLAKADSKSEREARSGLVEAYVHSGRIAAMVEVNCETDFVAKTDEFKNLAHDLAMQVAATNPRYLNPESIPKADLDNEKRLIEAELKAGGKPAEVRAKISAGKLESWYDEVCLSRQAFIKNPDQTIEELVKSHIAKLGENIVVRRFNRLELGENA
jgi:elongation factor Ts